ncbi:MAG: carboxypeptidase regulatory-like domain-containing protein [Planctomycetes bacterium]|nr:carboxypeptidase regulatory-like domain-containing protein [Planctomycetota bacterium]
MDIEVEASGGLRGAVRKGGLGVAGVNVDITMEGGEYAVKNSEYTAADGSFEFSSRPPGEYRVSVRERSAGSLPARWAEVLKGRITAVDFDLDSGILLRGKLTEAGHAAAGYSVNAHHLDAGWSSPAAKTDSAGSFAFILPLSGVYSLNIDQPTENASELRLDIQLPEGSASHEISFDLPASGIAGAVVEASSGGPVNGAWLAADPLTKAGCALRAPPATQ